MSKNIVIFASGQGSNTENIINKLENKDIFVKLIITNNKNAGVIGHAVKYNIPYLVISKNDFQKPIKFIEKLENFKIDLIVLAGFLWLIPKEIVTHYKKKIINIHPSLLPLYGGKGMYGMKVHEKVIKANDRFSGITIHYVNEKYDEGDIILQKKVAIENDDTPFELASKIHKLEFQYLPQVIQSVLNNTIN